MKKLALITAALFLLVAYSLPAYSATTGNGAVAVSAKANPKLEMSLPDASATFGNIDPETPTGDAVAVQVKSNDVYNYTLDGNDGNMAWTLGASNGTTLLSQIAFSGDHAGTLAAGIQTLDAAAARGTRTYNYTYTINLADYDVPAGATISDSVVYTATQ